MKKITLLLVGMLCATSFGFFGCASTSQTVGKTVTAEYEDFTVKYNESDADLIDGLAAFFTAHKGEALSFFGLASHPVTIQITPTKDEWKRLAYPNATGYIERDTVIRVLSSHARGDRVENFYKTVYHEFIHCCHRTLMGNAYQNNVKFLWEGFATALSGQYYQKVDLTDYDADTLYDKQKFRALKNSYPVAYNAVNKLLHNLTHEELLTYAKSPTAFVRDKDKIMQILHDTSLDENEPVYAIQNTNGSQTRISETEFFWTDYTGFYADYTDPTSFTGGFKTLSDSGYSLYVIHDQASKSIKNSTILRSLWVKGNPDPVSFGNYTLVAATYSNGNPCYKVQKKQ